MGKSALFVIHLMNLKIFPEMARKIPRSDITKKFQVFVTAVCLRLSKEI